MKHKNHTMNQHNKRRDFADPTPNRTGWALDDGLTRPLFFRKFKTRIDSALRLNRLSRIVSANSDVFESTTDSL